VRKQRVNARIRFHGRLRVQLVIHFVAFLRDREKVRISHNVKWIARFFGAHPTANRSIVVTVCHGDRQNQAVEGAIQRCSHEMNSTTIVAHFRGTSFRKTRTCFAEEMQEPRDDSSRGSCCAIGRGPTDGVSSVITRQGRALSLYGSPAAMDSCQPCGPLPRAA
jgi:hypothetical protein